MDINKHIVCPAQFKQLLQSSTDQGSSNGSAGGSSSGGGFKTNWKHPTRMHLFLACK